ncbi:HyaD/HybD family hydrogenase maturation endopeptidase [Marichromatium sp. PS1]|uniref:HyaD/HybD family hydrogenase maturation endopeptidase n=1 Tax=Marichromatium sp. PS1 TaxID=3138932 RepID=UPI0032E5DCDC
MSAPAAPPRTLLLGIGNLLWADEGFGVRVVEHIARHCRFGPEVRLLDGGTQGIYLVDQVRWAELLVIFDAVDYGLAPGTLKLVEGEAVPRFLGARKMSLHQTGFQEVLALAALLGDVPERMLLVGVQPAELEDFGGSLTPGVRAMIEPAVAAARDWLAPHGVEWTALAQPSEPGALADLPHGALALGRYEQERPSVEQACRSGDARVLERLRED